MQCPLNRDCLLYEVSVKGGSTIVSSSILYLLPCTVYIHVVTATMHTALATGNVKMKRVCFHTKCVCVVFSLSLETRRKSPLVPCSVYSWIIHGILKAFPFVIFCTLCLRRKRYSSTSVTRPGISTAY